LTGGGAKEYWWDSGPVWQGNRVRGGAEVRAGRGDGERGGRRPAERPRGKCSADAARRRRGPFRHRAGSSVPRLLHEL